MKLVPLGDRVVLKQFEAEEKTINYNHIFCSEALPTIADTFKTEYEIDPAIKTIHLRKVEYNKGEPLPL